MKQLKSMDCKLLIELMKNAKRSDREIAKALGSSQPTIIRSRARLEKDFIDGYTTLPKWRNIGFRIIAFTFVKTKIEYIEPKEKKDEAKRLKDLV